MACLKAYFESNSRNRATNQDTEAEQIGAENVGYAAVSDLKRSAKMKAALPLFIAMAFAGCAISQDTAVEAASPVGTFSATSESGAILLLQVKEDHSYVLSEHGYGAKTAPPIEGRWTTKKEGIALDPVPSIGGTLNLTRDGPKMSLTNDRIRFEKITVPEPNHAVQRTSATPPSLT